MKKRNVNEVLSLVSELEREGIYHFLQGDWQKEGGDIDAYVKKEDYPRFAQTLFAHGYDTFGHTRPSRKQFVKYAHGELLVIDAHIGRYEIAPKQILEDGPPGRATHPEKHVWLLVYKTTYKGAAHRYSGSFEKLLDQELDEERLRRYLEIMFRNADELYEALARRDWDALHPEFNTKYSLLRYPSALRNTSFSVIKNVWDALRPGPYFVIAGTDGSGKTTTMENVGSLLSEHFSVHCSRGSRFHFRALPLNFFARRAANKAKAEGRASAGGDVIRYRSRVLRYATPFVYYLEYLLRSLLILLPLRAKHDFVIQDRFYTDLVASKNASSGLAAFLYRFLPKPTSIVYLYNDLDVVDKRRPEHPRSDLQYQQEQFDCYQRWFGLRVKTDSVPETTQTVTRHLLERAGSD